MTKHPKPYTFYRTSQNDTPSQCTLDLRTPPLPKPESPDSIPDEAFISLTVTAPKPP